MTRERVAIAGGNCDAEVDVKHGEWRHKGEQGGLKESRDEAEKGNGGARAIQDVSAGRAWSTDT